MKDIEIRSTTLQAMPQAVLFDVPGFDAPGSNFKVQSRDKMRSAGAIVAVASAHAPSLRAPELEVFNDTDADGELIKDKMFAFANKADMADNLEANMEVIRKDWVDKYSILSRDLAGRRIYCGSAAAYKEIDKSDDGARARESVEKKGLSPGIDEFREVLQRYYDTERFQVLKRRVNAIFESVRALFPDMPDEEEDSGEYLLQLHSTLVLHAFAEVGPQIREGLKELRSQIREEAGAGPLRKDVQRQLDELITCERYGYTDEEIHRGIVDLAASTPEMVRVDANLREKRFRRIYKEFASRVVLCAGERHSTICNRIGDVFIRAMGIGPGTQAAERVREQLGPVFGVTADDDGNYYHNLVDRFARDLVLVQIELLRGVARFDAFVDNVDSFMSMEVFFDSSNPAVADMGDGEQSVRLVRPASTAPMARYILYPELALDMPDLTIVCREVTGLQQLNPTIVGLLNKLAALGSPAEQLVRDALSRVNTQQNQEDLSIDVAQELRVLVRNNAASPSNAVAFSDIVDRKAYEMYVASKHVNEGYHEANGMQMRREFDEDVKALHETLSRAFVRAIDIDKAFSAREALLIENVMEFLDTGEFQEFISGNIALMHPSEIADLEAAVRKRENEKALRKQIRAILAHTADTEDSKEAAVANGQTKPQARARVSLAKGA